MRLSGIYLQRDDWVDNVFTGEDDALEGFDEFAARVQFLYEPGDQLSALFNLHARTLDGTARMFRANVFTPAPTTSCRLRRHQVAIDGPNDQDLDSSAGPPDRLRLRPLDFHSITGYESVEALQPRRHRRRLRRRVPAPGNFGPGLHSFPGGIRGWHAGPQPVDAGVPPGIARLGHVRLAGGPLLLRRRPEIDSFNYDTFAAA